jgi:dipeptidyl aminopeptidase/acylaminoacyl peptidase
VSGARRHGTAGLVRAAALAAALAVPIAGAEGQQELRDLRLESVNEGVSFRDISYSPERPEVAFVSRRSGASKIWIVRDDGSDARLVVDDDGEESEVAWSPDGSRLAFVRPTGDGTDIWTVGRDGAGPTRVTRDPGREHDLAWGPKGERIAFLSARDGHQDVHVADVASGEVTRLTDGASPPDETRWAPAWSPDGRRIAYVSNRTHVWRQDLWLVDAETGESRKVTADLDVMTAPVWSPDGRHIAFTGVKHHEFWWGDQSDVYRVDVDDLSVRKVQMNTWVSDRNGSIGLAWGPDSESIYFRYQWEGDDDLWRVHKDGGVATKLTYGTGTFGGFSVSPDGTSVVYARSLPTRGAELHRVDVAGGPPERLTSWSPRYRDVEAPEKVSFRARDGKQILGYLYRPPGFDPEGSYPALVQVHGGGNNAYANGFHVLEHVLSHEGFVVLAIEYRGSAGHGRAFQRLSLGDWGAGQGWDAVSAARWLEAQPWSSGRVGIYGGSYGGIMTMAAVTRTSEPFDAAAPFYGVYDWADAFEHADYLMRFWIVEGHLGFEPGENAELYERTASIRHLDGVDRDLPFLLAHGERDRRSPYQQSVRLREALEARGNPVTFLSYPEERHGFREPENRLDAYGRLIDFMETHLTAEDEE